MKKVLAAVTVLLFTQVSMGLQMGGTVRITPNNVVVEFCNTTCDDVLTCRARVTGILNTGLPITEAGTVELPPGQCAYAYVYANYPFYFIDGNGFADCDNSPKPNLN